MNKRHFRRRSSPVDRRLRLQLRRLRLYGLLRRGPGRFDDIIFASMPSRFLYAFASGSPSPRLFVCCPAPCGNASGDLPCASFVEREFVYCVDGPDGMAASGQCVGKWNESAEFFELRGLAIRTFSFLEGEGYRCWTRGFGK